MFQQIQSTSQVTNFCYVILRHKYIESLKIAMNEVPAMHMLKSYAKIYEYAPDEIFVKIFLRGRTASLGLLLLLEEGAEVAASAVLDDDIDLWLAQLLVDE